MSRDLVTLGIASQNLTPNNPALDARPLMQAAIAYAQSQPATKTLTVDAGNYYLLSDQQPEATLVFGRLTGLTVDFAGSTIYFRGPLLSNGLWVYQCKEVVLKNFQTDFVTPPYTHVQLTAVNPGAGQLQYQPLPGWPDPATLTGLVSPFGDPVVNWAVFFRTGAVVPGTSRTRLAPPVGAGIITVGTAVGPGSDPATLATLQAGDTAVITARGGGSPILVSESDLVTLSGISIYGSPSWAVQVTSTTNSTVDGVRVMPRPSTGLIGSNGDGIHFASTRQSNHVRNSYVSRTMDDAIIMDNLLAATVLSQSVPRQLRVRRNVYLRFPDGTPVNFVDPSTTLESTGGTVVAQIPPDSDAPMFGGEVVLTFDRDLPALAAGTQMVYGSAAMRGQGSSIENNTVEDTYGGRGVWISGMRGLLVQGNTIRRASDAGIIVSQSTDTFDAFSSGPPSHDITIRGNVVEAPLGPAVFGAGAQIALAGIQVVSTDNKSFGFAPASANTNISIRDNRITNSGRSAIWIGEVNGGTVQGNITGAHHQNPALPPFGIPPSFVGQVNQDSAEAIVSRYNANVVVQGNTTLPISVVVEYYNANLDHYFVTSLPGEIEKLDAGTVIKGWKRTGQSFNTFTSAQVGTSPVCRYYIPPLLGDSHFFGRGTSECDATGQKNPSFVLEDSAFMHLLLPVLGVCPANTTAVYRAFTNRPDANHRYMTDKVVRTQMVGKNWLAEGDGNDLVVMCAPH